jgi:predicted SAM-dependent methyltransferase
LKSWLTTAILPVERRRARRWSASPTAIRLHLGCADNYLPGWLNVDLFRPGRRLDLFWDLRRPLPVPADSVQVVFTEHLLEHLSGSQALQVVRDCARVLSSEGVLRVGVPDLGRYIRSYAGEDPLIDEVRPGRPTKALAFCEVFYRFGHRSMYDFDTLRALCLEAGFADVEPSRFGEGRIQPSPDSAARRAETLYVDAIK